VRHHLQEHHRRPKRDSQHPEHDPNDRYGHLYQAARDRLRDHLEATYAEGAAEATATWA
jgi:hypothetical protein